MNEHALWGWMKPRLPVGDFTRIESGISPGLPDVSYAIRRFEGWIELKATAQSSGYPFKPERKGLRPSQLIWIPRRVSLGVHVLIVAAIGKDVAAWPGSIASRFNDLHVDELRDRASWWVNRRICRQIPEWILKS